MGQWRRSGAPPPPTASESGRNENSNPCPVAGLMEEFWRDIPGTDVRVLTSEGKSKSIPAHSSVLASSSPVLESLVQRRRPLKRGSGGDDDDDKKDRPVTSVVVPILGVPHNAVVSFLRCLYNNAGFSGSPPRLTDDPAPPPSPATETASQEAAKNGVHLLVLSHALQVPWLKRSSASSLAGSLTPDNVVDMLQLARMCDAPGLQVRCTALIRRHFKEVQRTEGWRFMQKNDPWLELEVLEMIEEDEKSDKRRRKGRKEIGVYAELGEAMQCLEHICCQGCHLVGPKDQQQQQQQQLAVGKDHPSGFPPCGWGHMCRGLQHLILHFASCDRKKRPGPAAAAGCGRCTRMWQLLRLHSAVCSNHNTAADSCCKVPFCRQFKEKAAAAQTTASKEEVTGADRWQLLAKKVGSAKVILNVSKRKRDQRPSHQLNQTGTATLAAHCT